MSGMMMCRHCGSRIPFIANVCPMCTRDLAYSGTPNMGDLIAFVVVAIFVVVCVIIGIDIK